MKRLSGVLVVVLAACTAARPDATVVTPGPVPSRPPSERYHPDMSNFGGRGSTCDYASGSTVKHIVEVNAADRVRDGVQARILKVGAPRWNTPNGRRPTQAEADAIVDGPLEYDAAAEPSIYRPLTVQVEKVYSGSTPPGTITVYAETGQRDGAAISSCAFGSPDKLLIRSGPHVATVGESYVMILEHRLIGTVIQDLFLVQGPLVVGVSEKLEPLP